MLTTFNLLNYLTIEMSFMKHIRIWTYLRIKASELIKPKMLEHFEFRDDTTLNTH